MVGFVVQELRSLEARYVFSQRLEVLYLLEVAETLNLWIWLCVQLAQNRQPRVLESFEVLSFQRDLLDVVNVVHQLCVLT